MKGFNFKSQICTDKIQSERLLSLGLKKETADMFWMEEWKFNEKTNEPYFTGEYLESIKRSNKWVDLRDSIPAWSLHRLLCLYNVHYLEFMGDKEITSAYDIVIDAITQAIEGGYFNEKYLV